MSVMSAIGTWRTCRVALHMSAFGGKADIIQGKADIKECPLMTQSGHSVGPLSNSSTALARINKAVHACDGAP
jgi:hypothetical protein